MAIIRYRAFYQAKRKALQSRLAKDYDLELYYNNLAKVIEYRMNVRKVS